MTAIVGVETRTGVVMGADAAASEGYSFTTLTTEKLWISGDYIIGSCGSFRINQLLRYSVTLPQVPEHEEEIDQFMATHFVTAVKDVLRAHGCIEVHHDVETTCDYSDFLVGVRGRVYLVACDFAVIRSATGYMATGSGVDLALGALHATRSGAAVTRVKKALEAAAAHNSAVAPPFVIAES